MEADSTYLSKAFQFILSSGKIVKDILASRTKDDLSYKYQMLVEDSPQPGFHKEELKEIDALHASQRNSFSNYPIGDVINKTLKDFFGERRGVRDLLQFVEKIRHLVATASLEDKMIIIENESLALGGTQENSEIHLLIWWICKAMEKFIFRFIFNDSKKLETDMSEGTFTIRYLGCLIDDLFTGCQDIQLQWGDKALVASTENRNMRDSDEEDDHNGPRQRIGDKNDCIGFRVAARREDGEELLIVEVAGPPCVKDEMKYKRDRRKLLKCMKLALDRLVSNMDVEIARRMCVYGLLVYGFKMTVYRCQLLHYRVYTTTIIDDLLLPTCFDQIKRLNKVFKVLIRMKLEMLRLIEEKKDADWDIEEKEDGIDLRNETKFTPRKKSKSL